MNELFFYDRERNPIMRWFDFFLEKKYDSRYLRFKVEITISIFSVKTEYDVEVDDILKLRDDLKQMHDQKIKDINFCLLDEYMNIELTKDEHGIINVRFYIEDKPHNGNIKFSYLFDQSFLPELIDSFNRILRNVEVE